MDTPTKGHLVITRRPGESIIIETAQAIMEIKFVERKGAQMRMLISGDKEHFRISRKEVYGVDREARK